MSTTASQTVATEYATRNNAQHSLLLRLHISKFMDSGCDISFLSGESMVLSTFCRWIDAHAMHRPVPRSFPRRAGISVSAGDILEREGGQYAGA